MTALRLRHSGPSPISRFLELSWEGTNLPALLVPFPRLCDADGISLLDVKLEVCIPFVDPPPACKGFERPHILGFDDKSERDLRAGKAPLWAPGYGRSPSPRVMIGGREFNGGLRELQLSVEDGAAFARIVAEVRLG